MVFFSIGKKPRYSDQPSNNNCFQIMVFKVLLLLLSRFSCVRLCATPQTAAHQASPSLGFSRQEHWSGLPFPSPMHESEKWKGSRSVVSDPQRPHGLQPSRLLRPWDFPGKRTGVGCHCLLHSKYYFPLKETKAPWRTVDPSLGKEMYKLSLEDFVTAESKEAFKNCQPEVAPTG